MTTTNELIKAALDYAYLQDPQFMVSFQRNDLEQKLQTALDKVMPSVVTLAQDKPDYESILFQFVQELQSDDVWKDTVHVATGQRLLSNIAAGVTYLHHAMIMAVQNATLRPGSSKNSVYSIMNTLGVNVRRKVPQSVRVRLTIKDHTDSFVVPKLTQFNIAGVDYFNRNTVTFAPLELTKDLPLYQGTLFSSEGKAAGNPYETIDIGFENFAISDDDVYVFVDDSEWIRNPLLKPWMAKNSQKVFFTKTLETGNVQVRFGNNLYGKTLPADANVEIKWAETLGADAPTLLSDANFVSTDLGREILGLTLSPSYGGDNELEDDFYKIFGPHLRASNLQGIHRASFRALATEYPNVRDSLFRGQAELAPYKRSYNRLVEVTALTASGNPMSSAEWEDFIAYIQNNSIDFLDFRRRDPIIIDVRVKGDVYCTTRANLDQVESVLTAQLIDFTKPRIGAIGYSLFESDCTSIMEGKFDSPDDVRYDNLIEYVQNFRFEYATQFNPNDLPYGVISDGGTPGINEAGDGVIANYISYVRIKEVDIDVKYTPRKTYSGRTDILLERET